MNNLVILICGFSKTSNLNAYTAEINNTIRLLNNSLEKKKTLITISKSSIFVGSPNYIHTPYDLPNFEALPSEISIYEEFERVALTLVQSQLDLSSFNTVINIIHDTEDFLEPSSKLIIKKLLTKLKNPQINFFTTNAENMNKSLDFKTQARIYSSTSVGIKSLADDIFCLTLKQLRKEN